MNNDVEVKCNSCGQTLFFKHDDVIEIKCRRCKSLRRVVIQRIIDWVESVLKI
jgi:phage FluMu protein Com